MPCDYSKYPANWLTEIRPAILKRADDHCEICGLQNRWWIKRNCHNPAITQLALWSSKGKEFIEKGWKPAIEIVLTIAHLDHDITNNDPRNLRALCQRCHNLWDAKHRAEIRRKGKR